MKVNESAENYLETILILQKRNGSVRSIDIAHELSFSKPSVSVAIKGLKESGYILIDENNSIVLTELGLDIAEDVHERHQIIAEVLQAFGVDEATADADSNKIKHYISDTSLKKIKEQLKMHTPSHSRSGDIDVVLL